MTRKDFELIAFTIKVAKIGEEARKVITEDMATQLAGTNPRFNDYIFFRACGVTTGRGA